MLRAISAEFDSIDSAEAAATRIHLSGGKIKKIKIIPLAKKVRNEIHNTSSGILTDNRMMIPYSISTMNYAPSAIVIAGTAQPDYSSEEVPQRARMSITCENEMLKHIEQIIISMGGLSIRTS